MLDQLGENLARLRTGRGLTQEELGAASGVSVDTISRLERGTRKAVRGGTLSALARSLGVTTADLLGMRPAERDTHGADQLRRAVHALDLPDFAEVTEVLPLEQLTDASSVAWAQYLAGQHAEMLTGLPALMVDTRRAVHATTGDDSARAAGLLATSYRLAAGLAGRLQLTDLAAHAAHRALQIAPHTSRPELDEAAAMRYLVWVLVRQGDYQEAERIALHAAQRLDPGLLAAPDPDQVGVFGSLIFNAASAAARGGNVDRADELLRVASAAAVRDGQDRTGEAGVFGPRVAAMQAVDQAVRAGQPDRAVELSRRVPPAVGRVPAFWEAGHRLHLAAAAVDLDEWQDSISHMEAARSLAPQWARVQPLGQVVMANLLEHWPARRPGRVAELAQHYAPRAAG
ncbi:helix-turn-helix domain-containing protein [Pseudonocardia eucalypti]|uniref:Helix-turn-helix domain-containing protein n=1 Tax=Pseudonocardia eucalypti TaxID=648755 RepID=A0ABP9RDF1_9PSEU|nr:transcriptional regulator with XRE-family HTH domain [Pseudonocardia eucalypti]